MTYDTLEKNSVERQYNKETRESVGRVALEAAYASAPRNLTEGVKKFDDSFVLNRPSNTKEPINQEYNTHTELVDKLDPPKDLLESIFDGRALEDAGKLGARMVYSRSLSLLIDIVADQSKEDYLRDIIADHQSEENYPTGTDLSDRARIAHEIHKELMSVYGSFLSEDELAYERTESLREQIAAEKNCSLDVVVALEKIAQREVQVLEHHAEVHGTAQEDFS